MAKYDVTYACGHDGVVQLFGRGKDREWKLKRYESQLCDACAEKQKEKEREEANAEAAATAKKAGLPELVGSEKQIKYGETCRQDLINLIIAGKNNLQSKLERGTVSEKMLDKAKEYVSRMDSVLEYIKQRKTKASWWIENYKWTRGYGELQALIDRLIVEQGSAPSLEEEKREQEEAEEQKNKEIACTVRPENPVSEAVAKIRLNKDQGTITIHFAEFDDKFRKIVKERLRMTWSSGRWERKINEEINGTLADRVAEAGHLLLAEGFIVQILNEELLNKAISADYNPEHTNWIVKKAKSNYIGWFAIRWDKNDDFYNVARRIPESRYASPYVVVPPHRFEELLDFAERYDFRLTQSAYEIVEQAREERDQMPVVDVPKPREKKKVVADTKRPELTPEEVGIDEEFRDDN